MRFCNSVKMNFSLIQLLVVVSYMGVVPSSTLHVVQSHCPRGLSAGLWWPQFCFVVIVFIDAHICYLAWCIWFYSRIMAKKRRGCNQYHAFVFKSVTLLDYFLQQGFPYVIQQPSFACVVVGILSFLPLILCQCFTQAIFFFILIA